ncbi:MAG: response regulator [Myxococcota bacterium]
MPKRILVVDDSRAYRHQVSITLSREGYEVIEASDGLDALEKRAGCDLTLCDVNMPRMDGLDFLDHVAREGMPIVMLTAEAGPAFVERARAAGAKAWIIKPFKPEQLLSVVRKLVE